MALDLGFVMVEYRMRVAGQTCINALYYGFPTGTAPPNMAEAEVALTTIYDQLLTNGTPQAGVELYRGLIPLTADVTSFKVLLRAGLGMPAIQLQTDLNLPGTRTVTSQFLAPNLTYTCYGRPKFLIERGAKTAFSGGCEEDYDGAEGWTNDPTDFARLCEDFLIAHQPLNGLVIEGGTYTLMPAVIPRVRYETPSGAEATRLPVELTDVPVAVEINRMTGATYAGRNKKRQIPPRGS